MSQPSPVGFEVGEAGSWRAARCRSFRRRRGGATVWISEIAIRLMAILSIPACFGLGGLMGYLLPELASVNLFFAIAVSMISTSAFLVLFAVIRWYGLFRLPGAMATSGYVGAVTAAAIRISIILGRPLWVGVILAVVCVLIGFYVGVRDGGGSQPL